MSIYTNVYRASGELVFFNICNLLAHIDGHITVWLRPDTLAWCWTKTADFRNLVSTAEIACPELRLPTSEDTEVIWPHVLHALEGTCDRHGRFILPADQEKAEAFQTNYDASPPTAWQRDPGRYRRFSSLPWGASCVCTSLIIESPGRLCDDDETLNRRAAELLGVPNT